MTKIISQQSIENMKYVRGLLKQKQPAFAAALELAAELAESELRSSGVLRDTSPAEGS
jgi:hypothetical protein